MRKAAVLILFNVGGAQNAPGTARSGRVPLSGAG